MAEIRKMRRSSPLFRPAQFSAEPPYTASLDAPGDVREAIHKAAVGAGSAVAAGTHTDDEDTAHYLQRINSSSPTGSVAIVPATDIDQLQSQQAALTRAFEREFGRLPTPDDQSYWGAFSDLVIAYMGTHFGEVPTPPDPKNGTGT